MRARAACQKTAAPRLRCFRKRFRRPSYVTRNCYAIASRGRKLRFSRGKRRGSCCLRSSRESSNRSTFISYYFSTFLQAFVKSLRPRGHSTVRYLTLDTCSAFRTLSARRSLLFQFQCPRPRILSIKNRVHSPLSMSTTIIVIALSLLGRSECERNSLARVSAIALTDLLRPRTITGGVHALLTGISSITACCSPAAALMATSH